MTTTTQTETTSRSTPEEIVKPASQLVEKLKKTFLYVAIFLGAFAVILALYLWVKSPSTENQGATASLSKPQVIITLTPVHGVSVAPVGTFGDEVRVLGEHCAYVDDANILFRANGTDAQHRRDRTLNMKGLNTFAFQSLTGKEERIGWTQYPPGYKLNNQVLCPVRN